MRRSRTASAGSQRWIRPMVLVAALTITSPSTLRAVEFSTIEHNQATFTVCRVTPGKDHLALVWRDAHARPFRRLDALAAAMQVEGRHLAFAMNAGMFQPDLSPVGLLVIDGGTVAPLNTADGPGNFFLKPNGIFVIHRGSARIIDSIEYASLGEPVSLATQSGPLLVRGGTVHPALSPTSTSRHRRNGVGVCRPDTVLFVISEDPVTLHAFALLFRNALACPDALYLDGAISSLHAPALHRSDNGYDLGPILAVVE